MNRRELLRHPGLLALLVGPALAGVLIGVMGAAAVLLVDAAAFVVGLVLVAAPAGVLVAATALAGLANGVVNAPIHWVLTAAGLAFTSAGLRERIHSGAVAEAAA